MKHHEAPLKWRHFEPSIILSCVRWYCRYQLSYRDLEELMKERGLAVDHTTVFRRVRRYAPEINKRTRSGRHGRLAEKPLRAKSQVGLPVVFSHDSLKADRNGVADETFCPLGPGMRTVAEVGAACLPLGRHAVPLFSELPPVSGFWNFRRHC